MKLSIKNIERDIIYIKNLIQKSEHMRNIYTPGNKLLL